MTEALTHMPPISLTIDGVTFDRYHCDELAGSICFHTGPATCAVDFDETVEDHLLRFDADGTLLSLMILNATLLLDHHGAIDVTLRAGGPTTTLERELVEPLLVDAPRYY